MTEERNRAILIGAASRWASEAYLPTIAKNAACWQVVALLDLDRALESESQRINSALGDAGPAKLYGLTGDFRHDQGTLAMVAADHRPDLAIISTAPDSHLAYACWSFANGMDLILDKPPVAVPAQFAAAGAASMLDDGFARLLAAKRDSRHRRFPSRVCNALLPMRRRDYWPYSALLAYAAEVQVVTSIPPTYLYIGYNDGSYRFPREYDLPGAHGYRTGLGILTHTGYHFLDFAARCFSRSAGPVTVHQVDIMGLTTTRDYHDALDQALFQLLSQDPGDAVQRPSAPPALAELDIDFHVDLSAGVGHRANLLLSLSHRGPTRRLSPAYPPTQTHDEARVDDTVIVLHQGPFQTIQITICDDAGGAVPHGHCRLVRRLHPRLASRLGSDERTVVDQLLMPGDPKAWYQETAARFLAGCAAPSPSNDLFEFDLEDQALTMRFYSSVLGAAAAKSRVQQN